MTENNRRARILATGSYVPEFALTNEALCRMVDTSDEWIRERTGIRERRINPNLSNREMASTAAKRALEMSGLSPLDLDMIICSTITNDNYTPSLACYVQGDLGASNAFAFDINAGCSGFVYAMENASAFISSSRPNAKAVNHVLIVCSENLSRITDYTDRSSCVLFGDGAGAVIVGADEVGVLASYMRADGKGANSIVAPALTAATVTEDGRVETAPPVEKPGLVMNGREVYRFAVRAVPEAFEAGLKLAGLTADQLDYAILHQANLRIINAVIDRLGLDPAKVPFTIDRYGNTSSACIPVLLDEMNRSGKLKRGDKLAIAGFGSGLTYGVIVTEW
ncbi:MAG: ketoacyl-ACP synthase III [Clostridia bacterium]|nr:ketoacyl-ACP synthase III [Clostridia bacterium]